MLIRIHICISIMLAIMWRWESCREWSMWWQWKRRMWFNMFILKSELDLLWWKLYISFCLQLHSRVFLSVRKMHISLWKWLHDSRWKMRWWIKRRMLIWLHVCQHRLYMYRGQFYKFNNLHKELSSNNKCSFKYSFLYEFSLGSHNSFPKLKFIEFSRFFRSLDVCICKCKSTHLSFHIHRQFFKSFEFWFSLIIFQILWSQFYSIRLSPFNFCVWFNNLANQSFRWTSKSRYFYNINCIFCCC